MDSQLMKNMFCLDPRDKTVEIRPCCLPFDVLDRTQVGTFGLYTNSSMAWATFHINLILFLSRCVDFLHWLIFFYPPQLPWYVWIGYSNSRLQIKKVQLRLWGGCIWLSFGQVWGCDQVGPKRRPAETAWSCCTGDDFSVPTSWPRRSVPKHSLGHSNVKVLLFVLSCWVSHWIHFEWMFWLRSDQEALCPRIIDWYACRGLQGSYAKLEKHVFFSQ